MIKIRLCKYCNKELTKEDRESLYCSNWCREQVLVENTKLKKIKIKKVKIAKPKKEKKIKIKKFPFNCRQCKKRIVNKGYCSTECRLENSAIRRKYYLREKLSTG